MRLGRRIRRQQFWQEQDFYQFLPCAEPYDGTLPQHDAQMILIMQALHTLIAKSEVKKKLLDSGANITIISSLSHLDSNTLPTYLRAEKPSVVQTANKSTMDIQGRG